MNEKSSLKVVLLRWYQRGDYVGNDYPTWMGLELATCLYIRVLEKKYVVD